MWRGRFSSTDPTPLTVATAGEFVKLFHLMLLLVFIRFEILFCGTAFNFKISKMSWSTGEPCICLFLSWFRVFWSYFWYEIKICGIRQKCGSDVECKCSCLSFLYLHTDVQDWLLTGRKKRIWGRCGPDIKNDYVSYHFHTLFFLSTTPWIFSFCDKISLWNIRTHRLRE